MEHTRARRLVAAAAAVLAAPALAAAAEADAPDPRAAAVAEQVMEALGGAKAWNATRYLRFDFVVDRPNGRLVRSHTWDKWTGRYRVESTEQDGTPYVVLMNVNTRDGDAWKGTQQLTGEDEKKYLERGFAIWTNDTYWLLMPYKLRDPGVVLAHAGEEKDGEATYDKLHLSFEGVGLTPKDQYWVWVNRETRLVDRWDFVLKGESVPPTTFLWRDWKKVGQIMLAADRMNPADKLRIHFPVLEAPASLADETFTQPHPLR